MSLAAIRKTITEDPALPDEVRLHLLDLLKPRILGPTQAHQDSAWKEYLAYKKVLKARQDEDAPRMDYQEFHARCQRWARRKIATLATRGGRA